MLKALVLSSLLIGAFCAFAQSVPNSQIPSQVIPIAVIPAPHADNSVPSTFAPSYTVDQVPMVSTTTTSMTIPYSARPSALAQFSTALSSLGDALIMRSTLISSYPSADTGAKQTYVSYLRSDASVAWAYEEVQNVLKAENFRLVTTVQDAHVIQVSGKPWHRPNSCDAARVSVRDDGGDALVTAVFADFPGCIADKSVKDMADRFEKDLRKVQPDLTAVQ